MTSLLMMMVLSLLLLLLFTGCNTVSAASNQVHQSSTCVFQALSYPSWDEVMQCFYSIALKPEVKMQTIDALRKSMQMYTFLDISKRSPDPNLPVRVDVISGLDKIASWPYKYDYEFHSDLSALMTRLNDAHTMYYPPDCYAAFSVYQPFALVSFTDPTSSMQVLSVSPFFSERLITYYQSIGLDIKSFAGAQVVSIDGYPAFDFMVSFSNVSVGLSKDPGTRFNIALTRPSPTGQVAYGTFQHPQYYNTFPHKPAIDYVFRFTNGSQIELSVPWSIYCTKNYTGLSSFMNDYWAPNSPVRPTRQQQPRMAQRLPVGKRVYIEDLVIVEQNEENAAQQHVANPSELPQTFELLVNSTDVKFWQLSDNQTLVMYIDTMAPNEVEAFKALEQGFEAAASRNLNRLIIDLTNNGGGSICFGRALISYLQQSEGLDLTNYGPEDLICSPLQQNLTLSSVRMGNAQTVWSPAFYANRNNTPISQNDTSYLIPGIPHIRGGVLRNYTKTMHIGGNCGRLGTLLHPKKDFAPENIMILTHGYCGSTCALFSSHLAEYDNVRTVVYGGINNREQQFFSFPGGQVLDSDYLYEVLADLGQDVSIGNAKKGELCPRQLPTTAAYRFCVREIYPKVDPPKYSAYPLEFTFNPSTYHREYTQQTALYSQYCWYDAVTLF